MKPIIFTIVGLIFDYLLTLVIVSAVVGFAYLFDSSINVTAQIIGLTILVIIFDAFRARVMEEYSQAKSFLKEY